MSPGINEGLSKSLSWNTDVSVHDEGQQGLLGEYFHEHKHCEIVSLTF